MNFLERFRLRKSTILLTINLYSTLLGAFLIVTKKVLFKVNYRNSKYFS
jgi:hypothetical protein